MAPMISMCAWKSLTISLRLRFLSCTCDDLRGLFLMCFEQNMTIRWTQIVVMFSSGPGIALNGTSRELRKDDCTDTDMLGLVVGTLWWRSCRALDAQRVTAYIWREADCCTATARVVFADLGRSSLCREQSSGQKCPGGESHDGCFLDTLLTLTLGFPRKGLPFLETHPRPRLCHSPWGLGLGSLVWLCRISFHIHSGLNSHGLPSLLVVYGNLQAFNSCWWLIMSPSYLCVCFLLESLKPSIWSVVKGWSAERRF